MKKTKHWSYIIEKQDVKFLSEIDEERFAEEVKFYKNKPIRITKKEKRDYMQEEIEELKDKPKHQITEYDKVRYDMLLKSF